MKKFFVFLPILVASFFLLLSNVKAETTSFEVPNSVFEIYNQSFSSLENIAIDYLSNNSNFSNYYITYFENYGTPEFRIYYIDNRYSNNIPNFKYNNSYFLSDGDLPSSTMLCKYNMSLDLKSCISGNYVSINFLFLNNYLFFTDASTNITSNCNNDYTVYNGDDSYSFGVSSSCVLPTISYLHDLWYSSPPTPPDNTPILTNFINISIEKLSLICNFITSSYIYLTPFVILIFYFVILLFRRFR